MKKIVKEEEPHYLYNVNLDYEASNPFKKLVFFGASSSSMGAIIYYIAIQIFIGAVSEITVIGSIVVAGISAAGTIVGFLMFLPALVGVGIYEIYRKYKNSKVKKLYEGIKNPNNREYDLERELYLKAIKEFETFVTNIAKSEYEKNYKETVISKTKDILQHIFNPDINDLSETDLQAYIDYIKNKLYSGSQDTIKVLLLGKTGVGKSTLINNILKLDQNKAMINSSEPQKIEGGWPKKYPINKDDTNIKWLEIYDTEGIETVSHSDDKNTNDVDNHLKKVLKFINDNIKNPEKRIDTIWYCINGCRFENSEKEYITKLLEIYQNFNMKYPIQFLFLKAYKANNDDLKEIKKKLENFEYFKDSKGQLNFMGIIAEAKYYQDDDSNEPPKLLDDQKNLEKLRTITKDNYKTFLNIRLHTIINELIDNNVFVPLIEKMLYIIQESFEKMISEKKFFHNIDNKIEKAKEEINQLLTILSDGLSEDSKKNLEIYINDIKENLIKFYYDKVKYIKSQFDEKRTLQESMKKYIIEVYEKKSFDKTKYSMDKYIEDITDHLITPIATNNENFGFYFIFNLFREDIINCICEQKAEEIKNKKEQLDQNIKSFINGVVKEYLN